MWPLTQQAISFSPAISLAHCALAHGAISSIYAYHTRFDFVQFSLSEKYFTRIFFLLDEKKRITVYAEVVSSEKI